MTPAAEEVRAEIDRRGPIPFWEVVEHALYDPGAGFYAVGGRAGRRGDFLTSPEVGPLFGAVVARALDSWWDELGTPARLTVVEAGAGPGTLARSVLAASPRCAAALHYVLVERSVAQQEHHPEHPSVESRTDLPDLPEACVVVANELLDNLPFGLLERTAEGWAEVHVDVDGDRFVEVLVAGEADPAVDAPLGARVPVQTRAAEWVAAARALAGPGGRVVAFDYASTTGELARRPWTDWVRTYRRHQRGGHPLADLGTQDITCEVALDQLPDPSHDRSQAAWLRARGIEALMADARTVWHERAAIGDLVAVRARSRASEGEALLDEGGLGAFRALEWSGT